MHRGIAVETSNRGNSINDSQHDDHGGTVCRNRLDFTNRPRTMNGNDHGQCHSLDCGTRASEAVKFNCLDYI